MFNQDLFISLNPALKLGTFAPYLAFTCPFDKDVNYKLTSITIKANS